MRRSENTQYLTTKLFLLFVYFIYLGSPLRAQILYALGTSGQTISVSRIGADGSLRPIGSSPVVRDRAIALQVVQGDAGERLTSKWLYALQSDSLSRGTISGYRIGGDGGLTDIGSTPLPSLGPGFPVCISSDPSGRFLYVGMYNTGGVFVYSIGSDGSLTLVDAGPRAGRVYSIVVDPGGSFLYALNVGAQSQATITAFRIGSTGLLTAIGPPLDAGSSYGRLAMDPVAGFLYRPNTTYSSRVQWNILEFGISSSGSLTAIGATPAAFVYSGNIAADPRGRFIFSADSVSGESRIQSWGIGFDGVLTPIGAPVTSTGTGALALDPAGRFLYQLQGDNIVAYRVRDNGALSLIGSFRAQSPSQIAITACNVGFRAEDLCLDAQNRQNYRFESLTSGQIYTSASATMLSDSGTVIGTAGSGGDPAIFTRHAGVITPPGIADIRGINAAGDIVGTSSSGEPFVSAPPYDTVTNLSSVFGWISGSALAVNDRGDIVGRGAFPATDGTGPARPFTFDAWFPGLDITSAVTVNNARQVIGMKSESGASQYFLFAPGRGTTQLPATPLVLNNRGDILFTSTTGDYIQTSFARIPLPSGYSWTAMNDAEEVVGYSSTSSSGATPTVQPVYFSVPTGLIDLTTRVLNPETYIQITPVAINNRGEIAVEYRYPSDPTVAPAVGVGLLVPEKGTSATEALVESHGSDFRVRLAARSERSYLLNGRPTAPVRLQSR